MQGQGCGTHAVEDTGAVLLFTERMESAAATRGYGVRALTSNQKGGARRALAVCLLLRAWH